MSSEANENFELIERIGGGGFAEAWKARVLNPKAVQEYGTNIVALKLPKDEDKEGVLKKEILTNAALMQQLLHARSANLVRYLDFAPFRNRIVMVMEYVPGGSLRSILRKHSPQDPMSLDRALDIAEGILNGMICLHAGRVLHRDIKPENILMDGDEPKLADFGISRVVNPGEAASTVTGTYPYMSPEQLHGQAGFGSDQWSFGVMLYEMLAGRLPWREREPMPLVMEICNRTPRPPIDLRRDIPESVNDFVMQAIEKNPSARYASGVAMLEALRIARQSTQSAKTMADFDRALELVAPDRAGREGEEELLALLAKHPQDPRFFQVVGEYHSRCQDYDKAIAVFERGLAAVPEASLLHWGVAMALRAKGQARRASDHLKRAIALGLDAKLQRHAEMLLRTLGG